ncbi:MAG: NUDIX domain-containing protein [Spirochaetes bacterium]|nr:NUDIX domain-containing protein [Spirochaetota bacterium]
MQNNIETGAELLEVWDWENGLPTGEPVARDMAHREGVPHEAVHLWIVRSRGNQSEILFQQRAPHKENYPDCLDITVGGHVPYGFGGNKVSKEAREEIGITPAEKDLADLGWFRYEEKNNGLFQREFQHIFLLRDGRELDRYRFRDGEVTGIFAVRIDDLKKIMAGNILIEISGYNGRDAVRKSVSRRDFHPQLLHPSMSVYMRVILKAAEELAATGRVETRMPDL